MPVSFGSGVSRSFVQPDIFRGDTEPQTPNLGDLWVDETGVTPDLKLCTDLSPLTWTSVGGGGPSTTVPTLGITIDGGGSVLTTGTKGYIVCNKAGTIDRWDIIADQSGSIVMDVWKAANPSIPTNANSITGTEKPTLTAAQIASDTSLTTWTTSVAVGDVFGFEIESVSTITRVTLTIGMV